MTDRILIIDDDARLADMVREYLGARGYVVDHQATATLGLVAAQSGKYDAVLLDVMLPDGDGFALCRSLRQRSEVAIVLLTACGEEADRVTGLELGADDYLPKPFSPRELLARLRAVLRRRGVTVAPSDVLRFGELEIDRGRREVRVSGEVREMTSHQFSLLLILAERAGRVQSRDALMETLAGQTLEAFDRSIDVHISRIRAAIEVDPKHPRFIKTVRGTGYVFSVPRGEE